MKSGRGEKLKAARILWRMRALILEIIVWKVGRLDSKVPRFRAAHSSFKVSLMRKEQSSLEKWNCLPRGKPWRSRMRGLVSKIGVVYNLLISVDTQLHTGDTSRHAEKAWEIVSFSPKPAHESPVSDPPGYVAFPVRAETIIHVFPNFRPVKRAIEPPFPLESAKQPLGRGGGGVRALNKRSLHYGRRAD